MSEAPLVLWSLSVSFCYKTDGSRSGIQHRASTLRYWPTCSVPGQLAMGEEAGKGCGPELCQVLRKLFCFVTGSYVARVGLQLSM